MTEFKFSQNKETKALTSPVVKSKKKKGAGRPLAQESPRDKQVGCYLTQEEFEIFKTRLDGRPASALIRKLILEFNEIG